MLSNLYTILDSVTKKSCPVFEQTSDESAIRHFNGFMRSLPVFMRSDYTLLSLGQVDHDTNELILLPQRDVIYGSNVKFDDEEVANG